MNLKSLAKDTAIYGLSSIVGRFLNYLLVILYSYSIPAQSGGYGIVSNLYAWTALLLAILTFGMETTFFRFSGKEGEDPQNVFSTAAKMVGGLGLVFLTVVCCFLMPISSAMGYASHPEYILCFAIITVLDAFQAILFARLRQQKRPLKFVALKFAFIIPSILLNIAVFIGMPMLFGRFPALQQSFEYFDYGVGYIFFINLICTTLVSFGFIKELKDLGRKFDPALCKRMLSYTWPLLLLSLVGILNQVIDKILFPKLLPGEEGLVQLGIYSACTKVAMIMAMLVQAFRYAYEPIVFGESRGKTNEKTLSDGMKWYIIFAVLAFLGVMFYLPILKHIIGSTYWEGLGVVPFVMAAELLMGIYFNLSFWYKLSDQTWWGAIINSIAVAVVIAVNVIFVPRIGYWACAWGGLAGYGTSTALCWLIGRVKYPIKYEAKYLVTVTTLAGTFIGVKAYLDSTYNNDLLSMAAGTVMLALYMAFIYKEIKASRKA